ncbi:hypothetical protein EDM68_01660 [Candidatus Uhrbacteria bacterium]|nr:MAG: hypothetical protein EDM68_01660 [Candidatus Uhrbacteria bacterium]
MSEPLFVVGCVTLYLAIGFLVAGLSIRVWHRADSTSLAARMLFPWNAYDRCVGSEVGFSIYGELIRHDLAPAPLYTALIACLWPLKLFWCCCTVIYVHSPLYH